ncbi:ABC transporter ATP-binding protein [Helcobacillus massiliensis]|uniref:ABC transporter ATP-binding protein n=1 Tax=Helcobacillus massiliensis TaxID=521392 RepID=UPI0024834FFE|nr:ABC transporter ATP-binding protein [Helcobacillus massiliensis]MDK7741400.1 ABC transporter ATP-binding protein [Helcobacillus massiliensis]WOO92753.1 ABC transporter ATP-binding protein [Helcobacillus massiliensis]
MSEAVRLSGVTVRYAGSTDEALRDIDLTLHAGEVMLVTGRSGCGKSTLMGLVNGLVPHLHTAEISGKVEVHGLTPADEELHQMGRVVSTVSQNPRTQFFCADSTAEMAFAGENAGLEPDLIRRQIAAVTERLSMTRLLGRPVAQLSGGQKQQVAIAAAAVNDPQLYVLDEPTSNLDDSGVEAVRRLLGHLREAGSTVLITEHRLAFLRRLVDRVVVLDRGRIAMDVPAAEFFALDDERRRELGLRRLSEEAGSASPAGARSTAEQGAGGLEVEGLSYRYRRGLPPALVLDRLHVPRGRVTVVTGPNGAGKSTMVRVLSGLAQPQRGTIRLDGKPLDRRALLACSHVVMQDVNRQLFSDTVEGELVTGAGRRQTEGVLEGLGLDGMGERHPMSLSGGQRQRLAVAAAVAAEADLVFFDEPTSGLDHDGMLAIAQLARRLADDGRVVVIVTHDQELAAECADVVVSVGR